MDQLTSGVTFIHSAPAALCPHVEWALSAALGVPRRCSWTVQDAAPATYRAEVTWSGPVGTAARLVSTLRRFPDLRFEVTEDPTAATEGLRYSYTPDLGLFHAQTGPAGDLVVGEMELRRALRHAAGDPARLVTELSALLGEAWDEELEPYRYAGANEPVRWLKQVV
ncbi:MAG: DUF3145 domain-containing protein [Propionibacteriaceae bacterium]|jgi:hypothetical protein|nr:DUF3145 domain-containing protein [Propionibacteriaceae bacterium]